MSQRCSDIWHGSLDSAQSSAQRKKITKKITQAGCVGNQHLPLALSTLLQQNSQIFGTKPLPCRRFLQHYYRDTLHKLKGENRK